MPERARTGGVAPFDRLRMRRLFGWHISL